MRQIYSLPFRCRRALQIIVLNILTLHVFSALQSLPCFCQLQMRESASFHLPPHIAAQCNIFSNPCFIVFLVCLVLLLSLRLWGCGYGGCDFQSRKK